MSVFGYVNDEDENLQGKSSSYDTFGLTSGKITTFEFSETAGKDGAAADAILLTVTTPNKEYRNRIYDITGALYVSGALTEPGGEGYEEAKIAEMTQNGAVVIHALKALGVTDEQIKKSLATPPTDFKSWAQILVSLLPANFADRDVDVFLEYQWAIKADNTRTFLQLPQNMKGGKFLSPAMPGPWEKVVDADGLKYVNSKGETHVITRNTNYMESPKANEQNDKVKPTDSPITDSSKASWG
jgi:hypothetical protein